MAESRAVVLVALLANAGIAVVKFLGFTVTGSPAMLSETYHSISDTGNQIFLLIGIRYGEKSPTRSHPFGYGKAQFFYSFLVSVLLFGIAGWESVSDGYNALVNGEGGALLGGSVTLAGHTFPAVYVNYVILAASVCFEGYSLMKAYRSTKRDIERHDWNGFYEAFRKTSNVTTLTTLTEDTVAVSGIVVAFLGVFLTEETGNSVYDAGAALVIGLLLMGFAIALAWENQRLLLGESLPRSEEDELRAVVERTAGVDRLVDFRSVYFGPSRIIVTADVEFDPALDTGRIDAKITDIEHRITARNPDVKKVYIEPEV